MNAYSNFEMIAFLNLSVLDMAFSIGAEVKGKLGYKAFRESPIDPRWADKKTPHLIDKQKFLPAL